MAEFWSNNDRGYRIRLWIDQVSQDKVANTSQVRFQLALLNTTTTFAQYSCNAYIDFEGQRLNWSGSPSVLSWYQTVPLIDQTVTINHDFNGKKTFSFSAQFNGSGGWSPRTLTISGVSFTLTDIPRGSTTSDVSATIGSPVTIKINARQDSYRHAIWVKYGNYNQKITNENVKDSFTWTPPIELCNEIPNYTKGRGELTVVTYDGGREVASDTKTIFLNVPDYVRPNLTGISLTDTNVVARNIISSSEHFVQMLSNIKVSFDGASGAYGSTIDHYRAEIVGYNQTITSNGGTFGNLTFNGQVTIRATVTDSRGRQSEPFDKTITILEYFAPSLKIDVKRVGETSSTLEILRNAQIAPLTINGVQKNTMKLTFKVSPYGKNDYTTDNGPASGEWIGVSSIVNKSADLAGEYSAKHSWQVLAILEDKFTSTSINVDVPVERVVLSYDRQGLGVGKIREFGALDVLGDIYANDSQIQQYQLTSNNGGPKGNVGNANNLYEPGQYCLGPSAPGNPNGQWGFLFHYSYNGNNTDGIKEAIQTFWSNDGRLFFRHHRWSKIIDDWEPWKEFARNDNTNLINTGWQYAGYNNSFYKRVGDILTIKYDFVGNGDTITFATIPKEVFTAPQNYMLTIAVWIIDGNDNTHVQIDKGSNSLMALSTKNGWSYAGQLTIML
ncbi:hypothetical protein CHPC929_0022 [Streptococcus phage CHPC929]|nr:hypothetical protein CHPC929_0022 [Streptococcus phage CHPC929]